MERKRRKPLLASDHFGDFHEVVVDDVGKVVCRQLIGSFPEYLVVEGGGVDLHMSADKIVHLHDPVFRHLEADSPVCAGLKKLLPFILRKRKRVPQAKTCGLSVYESLALCLHLGPLAAELFSCVEGIICEAVFNELLGVLAVDRLSLALSVRRMRMTL